MYLMLLGTGTPAPSAVRAGSGYLVELGDEKLVFDHGPGAAHRLCEAGYSPTDIGHAFFSHVHYDHIADYPRLVLQRWDQGAEAISELAVYGPQPIGRITEQLIGQDGVFGPDIESRISHPASLDVYTARGGTLPRARPAPQVREVRPGDIIEGGYWRVTVGEARHFQPFLDCVAYRIDCDEGSIVYSGDSGGALESMVALAADCDVLIHMCHFASGTEPTAAFRASCGGHMDVAETARRAGARTLVLTHFSPVLERPGVIEALVSDIATVYRGNIVIGRDLLHVPTTAPGAPRID